jgi:hypothetical protein
MRIAAVGTGTLALAVLLGASLFIRNATAGGAATGAGGAGAAQSAAKPAMDLTTGWSLIEEGQAQGTIEPDAKNPNNPNPHILKISVTKYVGPGEGRVGAQNSHTLPVRDGQLFDVTFSGISEGIGVGLVFSLENAQGKVLARTTLPEIGRGGRGRGRGGAGGANGATTVGAGPTWRPYLVNLRARAADPAAHLVITPIEPVPVWLDGLTIVERQSEK